MGFCLWREGSAFRGRGYAFVKEVCLPTGGFVLVETGLALERGGSAWRGVCVEGALPGGGSAWRGVCLEGGLPGGADPFPLIPY